MASFEVKFRGAVPGGAEMPKASRPRRRRGIEAPKGPRVVRSGEGCALPSGGEVWGGGCAPPDKNF